MPKGGKMALERWDIVAVPAFVLGLPEDRFEMQFGVVVSARAALKGAERYWIVQIPNPAPGALIEGDLEIPYLTQILPPRPVVIRTSSIFAAHYMDLDDQPIVSLQSQYRRQIMNQIDKFMPRRP